MARAKPAPIFGKDSTLAPAAEEPPAPMGDNRPPLADAADLAVRFAGLAVRAEKIAAAAGELPQVIGDDDMLGQFGPVVKDARELLRDADARRVDEGAPFLAATRTVNAFFATVTDRMDVLIKRLSARADRYQTEKADAARRKAAAEAEAIRAEEARRRALAIAEDERNRPKAATNQETRAAQLGGLADEQEAIARAPAADLTRVRHDDGSLTTAGTKYEATIVDIEKMDLNELRHQFTRAAIEQALRGYVKVHRGTRPLAGVSIKSVAKTRFR